MEYGDYEEEAKTIVGITKILNIFTVVYVLAIIILIAASMKQFNEARRIIDELSKPSMIVFIVYIFELLFNGGKVVAIFKQYDWQDMAIFFELVCLCIGCVYSIKCLGSFSNSGDMVERSIKSKMYIMFITQIIHFVLFLAGVTFFCCKDTKYAEDPEENYAERNNPKLKRPANDMPESFKMDNFRLAEFVKNMENFDAPIEPDLYDTEIRRGQKVALPDKMFDIDSD